MKSKYRLYRRDGVFYVQDNETGKQESLRTRDRESALRLLAAKRDAHAHSELNFQIAQAYLSASDSEILKRTWRTVMKAAAETKQGPTLVRWKEAMGDNAFDLIRDRKVVQTTPEQFLHVLRGGTVSTNMFLRRLHNFALHMNWLLRPVLGSRQWPSVRHRERRAITAAEFDRIIQREQNLELRAYYQLLWHLGASQADVAALTAESVNRKERTISFQRQKTRTEVLVRFGEKAAEVLAELPKSGPLFPWLSRLTAQHRANYFAKRLRTLGIAGVTLHSFRYSFAERCAAVGFPERYAMQALGHTSRAIHRAYARKARVQIPALEEFEPRG